MIRNYIRRYQINALSSRGIILTRTLTSENTSYNITMKPIGFVRSCFIDSVGTPRQGSIAPTTRALIIFDKSLISVHALEDIVGYSHLWLIFGFSENTISSNESLRSKIQPPAANRRVSMYATRTPHRINPIGLTVSKIRTFDKSKLILHMTGVDLLEGTPVYDIKVSNICQFSFITLLEYTLTHMKYNILYYSYTALYSPP